MKLSLSTRVAEAPKPRKDIALMALPELAHLAQSAGYRALCTRASLLGVQSSQEELKAARGLLDELGLRVWSAATNNDVPANNDRAGLMLRDIGPHLAVARALGAELIRVGMKAYTDIPWAQRASDEAAEQGVRLAHQCHVCSLFETVESSLEVVREVGRENFGIIYEPANLIVCGQDYGRKTVRALAPHLFGVYLQNRWNHPQGKATVETWINGPVACDLVPFGDPRGTDFRIVFDALADVGYDGWVTVHQAGAGTDVAAGARQFADYLRSIAVFE